jgi:hypothetical protein
MVPFNSIDHLILSIHWTSDITGTAYGLIGFADRSKGTAMINAHFLTMATSVENLLLYKVHFFAKGNQAVYKKPFSAGKQQTIRPGALNPCGLQKPISLPKASDVAIALGIVYFFP